MSEKYASSDLDLSGDELHPRDANEDNVPSSSPEDMPRSGRSRGNTVPSFGNQTSWLPYRVCGKPRPGHGFPASFMASRSSPKSRRSTLSDQPELDKHLRESMVTYDGLLYLPMSSTTLHHLSPFWKGLKPIAKLDEIFERVLINKDINKVHADHVVAALERVGMHCKHLVVLSPIHTAELGEVFNREIDNLDDPSSDWSKIFKCFPNLESVTFKHPDDEPLDLVEDTLKSFQRAIITAGYPSTFKIHISAPPEVLKRFR
ncbi:unnamed protein product [Periconia digitata]|uniref:Uncharacterized protein n=1 Tax=Periconia digitata TaxID=1303443 RepID=A0A9W4UHM4_9PLEO|nr:unnamed protein product [Periconia digitata]